MSKIFVQIASYRDPELVPTLKDMKELKIISQRRGEKIRHL